MATNRGKRFEEVVKSCFLEVPGVSIDRVHDQTTHYKGSTNICDFIVYRKPYEYYIECKTTNECSFPFANLTRNQYEGMLEKSCIKGVQAGVIVWYLRFDTTVFYPISLIKELKEQGCKSVRHDFRHNDKIILCGEKKVVYWKYDMNDLLNQLERRIQLNHESRCNQ